MKAERGAFARVERTPEGHFRLFFYAGVFRTVSHARRTAERVGKPPEALVERFPFLGAYFRELRPCLPESLGWEAAPAWWREEIAAWERSVPGHLPLRSLVGHTGLSHAELVALILAGMVEEDLRFGALFAALQDPLPQRRPCLGLL